MLVELTALCADSAMPESRLNAIILSLSTSFVPKRLPTGMRRAPLVQVTVSIGGVNVPVSYAGPQGAFVGLDQVNVQLPASLAGSGDVPVILTVAGKQANTARMTFK